MLLKYYMMHPKMLSWIQNGEPKNPFVEGFNIPSQVGHDNIRKD